MFQGSPVWDGQREPTGYQQITDLSSAIGFTIPSGGARMAIIRVETKGLRWCDDGTLPTASVGMPMSVGDVFLYTGDMAKMKFIESEAGATLNVAYYR